MPFQQQVLQAEDCDSCMCEGGCKRWFHVWYASSFDIHCLRCLLVHGEVYGLSFGEGQACSFELRLL